MRLPSESPRRAQARRWILCLLVLPVLCWVPGRLLPSALAGTTEEAEHVSDVERLIDELNDSADRLVAQKAKLIEEKKLKDKEIQDQEAFLEALRGFLAQIVIDSAGADRETQRQTVVDIADAAGRVDARLDALRDLREADPPGLSNVQGDIDQRRARANELTEDLKGRLGDLPTPETQNPLGLGSGDQIEEIIQ